MKNIVFDLGGVLFARDKQTCPAGLHDFFSFVRAEKMPEFWEEYDRGTLTMEEVLDALSRHNNCSREHSEMMFRDAIELQAPVVATEHLIGELKAAGYRLYVLSNMAREYIAFLRTFPVYALFDGEVISSEEQVVKPDPQIYEILLTRYDLDPSQTLFVDDRPANITPAEQVGIHTHLFDYRDPAASCDALRRLLLDGK